MNFYRSSFTHTRIGCTNIGSGFIAITLVILRNNLGGRLNCSLWPFRATSPLRRVSFCRFDEISSSSDFSRPLSLILSMPPRASSFCNMLMGPRFGSQWGETGLCRLAGRRDVSLPMLSPSSLLVEGLKGVNRISKSKLPWPGCLPSTVQRVCVVQILL